MTNYTRIGLAALLAASPLAALADYPEKPVEFIVPFPPGDLEDVLTRLIADRMQEKFSVPAAVVNKPGGGGGPFPGAVEACGRVYHRLLCDRRSNGWPVHRYSAA